MVAGCLELLDQNRRQLIVAHFDGTQHVTVWTNENWDAETNLSHFMVKDHTLMRDSQRQEQGSERTTVDAVDRAAARVVALDTAMFPAHGWALEQQLVVFPRAQAPQMPLSPSQRNCFSVHATHGATSSSSTFVLTLQISAKSSHSDEDLAQTVKAETAASRARGPTYDIRLQMLPYHVFLRRHIVDGLMLSFTPPEVVARHAAARKRSAFERATSWRISGELNDRESTSARESSPCSKVKLR